MLHTLAFLSCAAAAPLSLSTGALDIPSSSLLRGTPPTSGPHVISIDSLSGSHHASLSAALAGCGAVLNFLPPSHFLIHAATPDCLLRALAVPGVSGAAMLPAPLRLARSLTEALAADPAAVARVSLQLAPACGLAEVGAAVLSACPTCELQPWERDTALVEGPQGQPLPLGLPLALAALRCVVLVDHWKTPQARNMHGRAAQLTTDLYNFGGVQREFGTCSAAIGASGAACAESSLVPFAELAGVLNLPAPSFPGPAPPPTCAVGCDYPACGNGLSGGCTGQASNTLVEAAGLTGAGQIVQVVDTGLDTGLPFFHDAANTPAPRYRSMGVNSVPSPHRKIAEYWAWADGIDPGGHGTHCAGSAVGSAAPAIAALGANAPAVDAAVLPLVAGTARDARIAVADIVCDTPGAQGGCTSIAGNACAGWGCTPSYSTILNAGYDIGARVSSNSWGPPDGRGYYTQVSVDIDTWAVAHPDSLLVWAADNLGNGRGSQSIGEDASAKNVLAVGATQDGMLAHLAKVRGGDVNGASYPPLFQPFSPMACGSVLSEANLTGSIDVTAQPTNAFCAALAATPVPVTVPGSPYTAASITYPYGNAGNFELALCMGCTPRQLLPSATNQARLLFEWGYYSRFATSFSSIGPTVDGRIKPDVTASGLQIVSSYPSWRNGAPGTPTFQNDYTYGTFGCGTGMQIKYTGGLAPTLLPTTAATPVPITTTQPLFISTISFNYSAATPNAVGFLTIPGAGIARRPFFFPTAAGVAMVNVSHNLPAFFSGALTFTWPASGVTVTAGDGTAPAPCFGTLGAAVAITLAFSNGGGGAYTAALDGTSMSTPLVSGAAALVRQYFTNGYYSIAAAGAVVPNLAVGFSPSAALMKATIVNSASMLCVPSFYFNARDPSAPHTPTQLPCRHPHPHHTRAHSQIIQ